MNRRMSMFPCIVSVFVHPIEITAVDPVSLVRIQAEIAYFLVNRSKT